MIEATFASLRKPSMLFGAGDEIVHIVDGRKKEEIGFFIPHIFGKELQEFIKNIEGQKKKALLARIANAQRNDPIGEGGIDDGIEQK